MKQNFKIYDRKKLLTVKVQGFDKNSKNKICPIFMGLTMGILTFQVFKQ